MNYFLAIDLGASGGRHIVGWEENGEIRTEEIYRFPNGMDERDGHLVWDTDRLFSEVKTGIRKSFERFPKIESLSIDTWGVDYVLLRGDEEVKPTYAYRDHRMDEVIDEVHAILPFEKLYEKTGIQFQKFNTVYQLYADKKAGRLDGATDFLMLPEYLMYKLTGVRKKEFTNATTTGMVNVDTLEFDPEIFSLLGYPEAMRKKLDRPGDFVGRLKPEIAAEVGGDLDVVLCATHDTGSAVEAIDMEENAPYISSGTWSLLGVKTPRAVNDEKSRLTNYSNEGGVGYNRYQMNITGMWIIQSLRREICPEMPYGEIADLAKRSGYRETFDVNDERFSAPKSMKGAIEDAMREAGKPLPKEPGDYYNSAYLSLGVCYDLAIRDLEANTGRTYGGIYIVGGGAKNGYLNAITEKYTGKKVYALPIEATAIGNLKVQMKAAKRK